MYGREVCWGGVCSVCEGVLPIRRKMLLGILFWDPPVDLLGCSCHKHRWLCSCCGATLSGCLWDCLWGHMWGFTAHIIHMTIGVHRVSIWLHMLNIYIMLKNAQDMLLGLLKTCWLHCYCWNWYRDSAVTAIETAAKNAQNMLRTLPEGVLLICTGYMWVQEVYMK